VEGSDGAQERQPRTGTKQALLVAMLSRKSGATIREIIEETGWKANTVHAALSTLRTSGRQIAVEHAGSVKRYRIMN
jgi:predicted transcriptional regulator